jgi:menaquinone-dependent protoporphyrinogen IX oxidase
VRVLLIYHSRTGVTHGLMKAIGAELEARNHSTTYVRLEPERRLSWLAAGYAALRRRGVRLSTTMPRSLMAYDLVLIAGPVHSGRPSAELNEFLDNMPDAIGRRVAVFATNGGGNADMHLKSVKTRVERAGGLIVYEDAVSGQTVKNSAALNTTARNIVEQLMRPSVW